MILLTFLSIRVKIRKQKFHRVHIYGYHSHKPCSNDNNLLFFNVLLTGSTPFFTGFTTVFYFPTVKEGIISYRRFFSSNLCYFQPEKSGGQFVRFHWQLPLLLRFCRIHTAVAGYSDSVIRPRFSKRRIGNQEVCQPARRYGKPDKCNTEARCKNKATDRRIARFTILAIRNGRMIPSPRRTPSVAILMPMKIKK